MVLNNGELWIEFSKQCGKSESLTNPETKETLTVQALFDRTQEVKEVTS